MKEEKSTIQEAGNNSIISGHDTIISKRGKINFNSLKMPKAFIILCIIIITVIAGHFILKGFGIVNGIISDSATLCSIDENITGVGVLPFYAYSKNSENGSDYQQSIVDRITYLSSELDLPIEVMPITTDKFYPGGDIKRAIQLAKKKCFKILVWGSYDESEPEGNKVQIHFVLSDPDYFQGVGKNHFQVDPEPFPAIEIHHTYSMNKIEDLALVIGALVAFKNGDYNKTADLLSSITLENLSSSCKNLNNKLKWSSMFWYLGQFERAEKLVRGVIEYADSNKCNLIDKANALDQLSVLTSDYYGDFEKAQELSEKAIGIVETIPERSDSILGFYYTNLACNYYYQDDFEKAIELQEQALNLFQKYEYPKKRLVANSYFNLSFINQALGNYDVAQKLIDTTLIIQKEVFPHFHEDIAASITLKAKLNWILGNGEKAIEELEEALEIRERILPENHILLAHGYHNLATVKNSNCIDLEGALENERNAIQIMKAQNIVDTSMLATAFGEMFSIYTHLNDLDKAKEVLDLSRELQLKAEGNDPFAPKMVFVYNNYTEFYYILSDGQKALNYIDSALTVFRPYIDAGLIPSERISTLLNNKSLALSKVSNCDSAFSYAQQAMGYLRSSQLPSSHVQFAGIYFSLSKSFECKGDLEQALDSCIKSKDIFLSIENPDLKTKMRIARMLNLLSIIYFKSNEPKLGEKYNKDALKLIEGKFPNGYYLIDEIEKKLPEIICNENSSAVPYILIL